ncbi:hypothetical protein E4T56_gene12463 [Termitomyces sp. T112]|nr:hypothetical protein E4T56_gene12463 [Termitomyces sp. T112]
MFVRRLHPGLNPEVGRSFEYTREDLHEIRVFMSVVQGHAGLSKISSRASPKRRSASFKMARGGTSEEGPRFSTRRVTDGKATRRSLNGSDFLRKD